MGFDLGLRFELPETRSLCVVMEVCAKRQQKHGSWEAYHSMAVVHVTLLVTALACLQGFEWCSAWSLQIPKPTRISNSHSP